MTISLLSVLSVFVFMCVLLSQRYMMSISKSIRIIALYCFMAFQLSVGLKALTSYSLLWVLKLACMFIRLTFVSSCFYRYIASEMRVNWKRAKMMLCLLSPLRNSGRHLLRDSEPKRGCENDGVCVKQVLCLVFYLTEYVWCESVCFMEQMAWNGAFSYKFKHKPAFRLF